MPMGAWITENWFNLLSAVGIVGSLLFTAVSLRSSTKSRRISNLLTITSHHREIWSQLYHRPELARVKDATVDLTRNPITQEENLFVKFLILHLSSTYHAMKNGIFLKPSALSKDIKSFFRLPIPKGVWNNVKSFQDNDFVRFVEDCLDSK
jgi:hypothetical protein